MSIRGQSFIATRGDLPRLASARVTATLFSEPSARRGRMSRNRCRRERLNMSTILLDQDIEIPAIHNLAEFRRWALSDDFPHRGRIDYIDGRIEVDMSPEDLFTHG